MAQLALHPIWTGATLRAGAPNFANLGKYRGADADTQTLAAFQAAMITGGFDWDDLKRVRDDWPGRLLVKGILHPQDAVRCVEIGCDGIVVSNHGGRQAAYMPAAIEALPAITAAVGDRAELLIDSGIRRGADVIRARALGASMALLGRTFAYGAGAGGAAGCERAFAIIRQELDYALGQWACRISRMWMRTCCLAHRLNCRPRRSQSRTRQMVCKPGSVRPVLRPGGWPFIWDACCHAPRATYPGVNAETRLGAPEDAPAAPLSGLAPGGVYHAVPVAGAAVGSYPTLSPLPRGPKPARRFAFCGTFPRVAPAGRYPAPCLHGARTFLPTTGFPIAARRPSDHLTRRYLQRA